MPLNRMRFNWTFYSLIRIAVVTLTFLFLFFHFHLINTYNLKPTNNPTPTPKEEHFGMYSAPKIQHKTYYKIAMVGDSMTEELGIYGGHLNELLNKMYKSVPGNQKIVIYNYAVGSKNIFDLHNQLTTKFTNGKETLEPLLSFKPDIILIESFGYNPLSQYGIQGGIKKQTETLDKEMIFITKNLPNSAIIFVATIAPNKETYALQEDPKETVSGRTAEAEERMSYIRNHMAFASAHNIPVIDILDKSLTPQGDGNLLYINPVDHIHPSAAGTDFIDNEIANFIFDSKILPM